MSEKVFIYLEGKAKFPLKCKSDDNLEDLRNNISKKISSEFVFLLENDPIELEDEKSFCVEDIVDKKKRIII